MKAGRYSGLIGLVIVAVFIWMRNPAWLGVAEDTLPALAAFPLFLWLARPWRWRSIARPVAVKPLMMAVGLFLMGILTNLNVLLALGWVLALGVWIQVHCEGAETKSRWRLLAVLICGFPWIALDAQAVGWWFRFTGAGAAEVFFSSLGFEVSREGTFLLVQGLPLSVNAACSGLNALQSMLLAGAAMAHLLLPGRRYYVGLALLLPIAWIANTVRIITLGLIGLSFGSEAALGWFHNWGGWSVLLAMFLLSWGLFVVIGPHRKQAS